MSTQTLSKALSTVTTAALFAFGLATSASAAEYTRVDTASSRITFKYTQMGVGMDGHFERFGASILFDPARLEAARASFELQLDSIDTGLTEANEDVKGKIWFDTAAHPVATFKSSGFKALGDNRYEVSGTLTIKGRSRNVSAPFTLTPADKAADVNGTFTLKRSDFAIGEGEWADVVILADEIRIAFQLRALQGAQ
ncbi:MAG: polyisoprenoid-binding protein [Betaproteobacteria bacterium HGW-Betaproteobacteria-19]|nr:MAG: polyisoprenoid-binding protein [Betaproteobacteria bacterium HGW-Betaproteobacteria-19]